MVCNFEFCNNIVPQSRLRFPTTKYCSNLCNRRAWYIRNNPNASSFLRKDKNFWSTETGKGLKWELYGAKLLKANHLPFNGNGPDLDWNNKKVDVKSCELYKRKNKRGKPIKKKQTGWWVFNRNKEKDIDYFLCFCLIKGKPEKILLIPNKFFNKSGLVIGKKSKYDRFALSS